MIREIHLANLKMRYKIATDEFNRISESIHLLKEGDKFGQMVLADAKVKVETTAQEYFIFLQECFNAKLAEDNFSCSSEHQLPLITETIARGF